MALTYDTPQLVHDNTTWSPVVTAANTNRDGTGTLNLIWTAGVQDSWLYGIRFIPNGANVATLARVFLFDGSTYVLWREFELPATTNSATVAQIVQFLPINKRILATREIYFVLATAVAAGWSAIGEGDNY